MERPGHPASGRPLDPADGAHERNGFTYALDEVEPAATRARGLPRDAEPLPVSAGCARRRGDTPAISPTSRRFDPWPVAPPGSRSGRRPLIEGYACLRQGASACLRQLPASGGARPPMRHTARLARRSVVAEPGPPPAVFPAPPAPAGGQPVTVSAPAPNMSRKTLTN